MDLPIVIPCFFYTQASLEAEQIAELCGKEVESSDHLITQDVHFFNITYVCKHPEENTTMINAGNEDFRSPLPIEAVLKLLK